ncbi:hypothetical protein U9M48_021760 [Paspalum notatum var. saurae]|uniref:Glabrous enhancer-binding protein-like DBD domain-containing protein n=1 Tax=Paspalum notatum var. saurae TaxID=547442 RepID=A0AAQ3TLB4_PASNO
MAPKRSAPQPPPPAASSDETGSGTGSEETDEEEEIAYSPPPAAPKNPAPPPQEAQESEGEDDDEDEDEEDEEEEDEDDGQEDEKANQNQVAPPPATKNPSLPPPNQEESETSDEEGDEETDEEGDEDMDEDAPQPQPLRQPQPTPVQEADEGKIAKPPSLVAESKKPSAPFQRTWSTDDEVRILEALDAHRAEDGTLPQPDALMAALAGSLDNSGCSASDLQKKVKSLKSRYSAAAKKEELPSKDHDRRLFELSKKAWGSVTTAAANGGAPLRDVSEMRELYPYLAEEVNALEKAHRGLFKREFAMISDDKARALDLKIKKSRLAQMKLYQRRYDLTKERPAPVAKRWIGTMFACSQFTYSLQRFHRKEFRGIPRGEL